MLLVRNKILPYLFDMCAASLSIPYCHLAWMSVYMYVCGYVCVSLKLNISENNGDSRLFPIGSLHESAQGESKGHVTTDITRPYNVIMVT